MYLGNSRILQGRSSNENAIGEWLAIAPEGANSGTYGVGDTSSSASENYVSCIEMIQAKLVVGGNFTTAYNGSGTTSCWRVGAFDGTDFISIKYNGSNEQGLTHSELPSLPFGSSLLRLKCVCNTMRGIYGSTEGEKDHILIGGYFNKVGNKNKNHLAKINSALEFEDTLTASNDSLTGWVSSINIYTGSIDVDSGGLGVAEEANTFAFIAGNGLTDGDGRASYVGERILIYRYDNSQETLLTNVNGIHPLAGMVDDSDNMTNNGGRREAFQTNNEYFPIPTVFPNLEEGKLKLYLHKVIPRDAGSETDDFEGTHYYEYNVYDAVHEGALSSNDSDALVPVYIPFLFTPYVEASYSLRESIQDTYMLYRGVVLSTRKFVLSGNVRGILKNHYTNGNYLLYNTEAPLGYGSLNQIIYNGKSYIITEKGPDQDKFIMQDVGYSKDLNFPDESGLIFTTFIDPSDTSKTIYVGGTFEFTDKNGVTAKNIAKFVPASSKL